MGSVVSTFELRIGNSVRACETALTTKGRKVILVGSRLSLASFLRMAVMSLTLSSSA